MAIFNYKLDNFVQIPTSGDTKIRIYDKYDKFIYSIEPKIAYFYYKNNYVIIKQEDDVNINLDFESSAIAIQALQKLNLSKKQLLELIETPNDYYTQYELDNGILDTRYYTHTAITSLISDITLSGLSDVNISGITDGEVLSYSGGTWIPTSTSTLYNRLDTLLDVSISAQTDGEFLQWNDSTSVWENKIYSPDLSNYYTTGETQTLLSNYSTTSNIYNISGLTNYWQRGDLWTRFEISRLGDPTDLSPYSKLLYYYTKPEIDTMISGITASGFTKLESLLDVSFSSVTNQDLLVFDSSQNKWINSKISLTGLTDVDFTNPNEGDSLVYSGDTWVSTAHNVGNQFIPLAGTTGVTGNIEPSTDGTISLGSTIRQWKDIWVSGGTIYLNRIPLRSEGNDISFDDDVLAKQTWVETYISLSASTTLSGLTDTNIINPSTGETLIYYNGHWTNSASTNLNNYLTDVIGNGNSSAVTYTRNGLSDIVVDFRHNHNDIYYTTQQVDSDFVSISGDTMIGDLTISTLSGTNENSLNVDSSGKIVKGKSIYKNVVVIGNSSTTIDTFPNDVSGFFNVIWDYGLQNTISTETRSGMIMSCWDSANINYNELRTSINETTGITFNIVNTGTDIELIAVHNANYIINLTRRM